MRRSYVAAVFDGMLSPEQTRRIGFPVTPEVILRSRRVMGGHLPRGAAGAARKASRSTPPAAATTRCPMPGAGYCVFNDLAVAAAAAVRRRPCRAAVDRRPRRPPGRRYRGDLRRPGGRDHLLDACGEEFPRPQDAVDARCRAARRHGRCGRIWPCSPPNCRRCSTGTGRSWCCTSRGSIRTSTTGSGRLALTDDGIAARDRFVVRACADRGIPLATTLGGGYGSDVAAVAMRHARSIKAAADAFGLVEV